MIFGKLCFQKVRQRNFPLNTDFSHGCFHNDQLKLSLWLEMLQDTVSHCQKTLN